ncbi:cytochrome b5 domain-containing [Nannochloropsis gaditana]|uniref:Cytochrome b5 domain-containing n=1 Tax=Nannochloropsis gaditana TaxID=72520 RepID=W7T560_9STRA|nr:cytochrome b5 domain-containing [Nannochloropsis gaditana]
MRKRTAGQRSLDYMVLPTAEELVEELKKKQKGPSSRDILGRAMFGVAAFLVMITIGWQLGKLHRHKKGYSPSDLVKSRSAAKKAAASTLSPEPSRQSILSMVEAEEEALAPVPRLFTAADLQRAKDAYTTASPSTHPILLAIVGHVFDVSKGAQFYAPPPVEEAGGEGGGEGGEEGLREDVDGLSEEECRGVWRWVNFFKEKEDYPFVGRLVGMYFDGDGRPTRNYLNFRACVGRAGQGEGEEACATSWEKGKGHTVWCEGAGKVPRRRVKEGGREGQEARGRCVCVDLKDGEAHAEEGDGSLVVYPGCEPRSSLCTF